MRNGVSKGRDLFREYVRDISSFWPAGQAMQVDKLRSMIEHSARRYERTADSVIEQVAAWAEERDGHRPAPVYITGLGGSGTNWLAAMLAELDGFAYAGEVYFPPLLLERMGGLSHGEQGYVIDCVHLLHAWPRCPEAARARVVNSASRAFEAGSQKLWDPSCTVVYLVRDPRDQVLSVTFRKPTYRKLHGAGRSDVEYLAFRCGSNRKSFERFEQIGCDFRCRYEELREDTWGVFDRLLAEIGARVPAASVADAIFRHDARNMRAGVVRRRGNLDEGGEAKGWRVDASEEQRQILHAELVDAIDGLGYEPDDCMGHRLTVEQLPRDRTLRFPSAEPVGTLYFRQPEGGMLKWRRIGGAQGEISVPDGAAVKVRLSSDFHPKLLRRLTLREGDVQSLCLAGNARVTDATLPLVRGLPGLRELDLARTRVTDAGIQSLEGLDSIHGVSVWRTRVTPTGASRLQSTLANGRVIGISEASRLATATVA